MSMNKAVAWNDGRLSPTKEEIDAIFDKLVENARNEPYAAMIREQGFDPETHMLVFPQAEQSVRPRHLKYVRCSPLVTSPVIVLRVR